VSREDKELGFLNGSGPGSQDGATGAQIDRLVDELMRLAGEDGAMGLLQFRSRATAHQYRRLYDLALREVPRGARVLDWGCGNGHFSWALVALGYDVTGFSFEDFPLRALMPGPHRFVRGRPEAPSELPLSAGDFDAVFSVGVLEHVRETGGTEEASLTEISRVLRPGGCFVCYHFPNRTSAIEAAASLLPGIHHHEQRFSRGEISSLCTKARLELTACERYGILPRNLLHRLPRSLRGSKRIAGAWDAMDHGLESVLSPIAQNHLFVARKRA
jgi:SAM-dependent methyltransferase